MCIRDRFHDAVEFLRFAQFDRQQQSAAADFTHGGMVAEQLCVECALRLDPFDDLVVEQVIQCREPGCAAYRMSAEGRCV